MNPTHSRLCRARPKLDYAPPLRPTYQPQALKKASRAAAGVQYIRCGGGFRILRRNVLPGEDRCSD